MKAIGCGWSVLALVCCLPAAAKVDPKLEPQIAGVFSNACGNAAQPMIRLFGDTMSIEIGSKKVAASKFRSTTTPPTPAPADYKATIEGEVPGGDGLVFVLTHNAQGLFATVAGGAKSLAPLGPGIVGQRIRHCDPNRNALPGTKPPVEIGPPEMLRDGAFKSAYVKALGPLAKTYWLTRLEGPAQAVKTVKAAGADYQLVTACKPHDCYDHSIVVLYAGASRTVFGKVHQAGRSTLVGNPPPAVAAELERLWLAQYRQKN